MTRHAASLALLLACAACSPAEPHLVSLAEVAPDIAIDMRYATANNFVGAPIDGYQAPRCLLTRAAAEALGAASGELAPTAERLVVFDCYRPQRAVDHFVRWAADLSADETRTKYYPRVPKAELFERGYIAEQSGHSRGSTVDIGLLRRVSGGSDGIRWLAVDMGTDYDFFDPRSHTESPAVSPSQRANRLRLRQLLERHGFSNYPQEWWHFTLQDEPYPDRYFDVVVK